MKRIIKAELGINTLNIIQEYNFTQLDKNLQSIYCKFLDEVDIKNYDLLVKYKLPNSTIIADTYELNKELDIIVPAQALVENGILNIEFCYISKDGENTITINKNMSVYIKKTLEVNTKLEDVVVGDNIATLLNRITTSVNKGIESIEKHTQEQINSINARYKSIQESLQEKETNAIENISNTTTQKITSLENKTKECIEDIYSRKADFKGDKGDKGEKGDPGIVDYSKVVNKNGDTMNGHLVLKSENANEIILRLDCKNNAGGIYRTENGLVIWNDTAKTYLQMKNDGICYYPAHNLITPQKEVISAVNSIYNDINTSLTLDSPIGNHLVLKRSGELKGSLTSNLEGISLYNEKSKKMVELRDNGDVIIPANNLETENKDIVLGINELKKEIAELREEIQKLKGE